MGTPEGTLPYGLLAEYATPSALLAACVRVRDAGYRKWDAYTPFPVHGIDPAMGIRRTLLPWLVLAAGLTGCAVGLAMQYWMNGIDYAWIISGKPLLSIPAFIPVTFELTILFSALTAFLGSLVLNLLPDLYHPLFAKRRFARVTNDRFFIAIEAADPLFDASGTRALLVSTHPTSLEAVEDDSAVDALLPRPLVYGVIVAVVLSFVPMMLIAKARVGRSKDPPTHLVFDMDNQRRFFAQGPSSLFADGRMTREPVPGTVALDGLRDDDHYYRGRDDGRWAATFPERFRVSGATMARGKERFEIFCAPCHGHAGAGDGMIARRAEQLGEGTWVPPTSIHADSVRLQPPGQLFNTVSNGVRNMPGYASQIPEHDRWAIVLYLKALQRSRMATLRDVPADERGNLR